MSEELKHSPITTKKITRNVWVATCTILKPLKVEIEMKGSSEENAKKKLELFLNNDPYSHLS